MDIKIENNDIQIQPNGNTVYINGFDEIVQRVKIACTVKKGSFIYDRELGVDRGKKNMSDMSTQQLEMLFREACINIPYTSLEVVSVDSTDDKTTATIKITCGTQSVTTEVTVNGQLQ